METLQDKIDIEVLNLNLQILKNGLHEPMVMITKNKLDKFLSILESDERYEDCQLLIKNKKHFLLQ